MYLKDNYLQYSINLIVIGLDPIKNAGNKKALLRALP